MDTVPLKPRQMFPDKPKYASSQWYRENVPMYKEKQKEWQKKSTQKAIEADRDAYYQKKRDHKNDKYKNDPEFAARRRQAQREYYQRKKAAKAQAEIEQIVQQLVNA